MEWFKQNVDWIFSGIGISILAILIRAMSPIWRKFAKNRENLAPNSQAVNAQNSAVIHNTGTIQNVTLALGDMAKVNLKQTASEHHSLRLAQFAIDESLCRFRMHRYDSQMEIYPGTIRDTTAPMPEGRVHYLGRTFNSLNELEEYVAELKSRTNHYYFGWLSNAGYDPTEVPIVCEMLPKDKSAASSGRDPVFTITISNDTFSQVVLTSLEVVVHKVIFIRAVGDSHVLASLVTYDVEISSKEGIYSNDMIPPLKIAGNDSARFGVRFTPPRGNDRPTGKVLIVSINLCSLDSSLTTPKFMLYFED